MSKIEEYDYLLRHFDENAGQKEEVALALYVFEINGEKQPTRSNISELLEHSRSGVQKSSLSSYIQRLNDSGWIVRSGDNSYRLKHEGEERVEALLDEGAFEQNREGVFIDLETISHPYYAQLVDDINRCYKYKVNDGVMVLTRKLHENLVFEILRAEYSDDDPKMFYDTENHRHYRYDELLDNLKVAAKDVRRMTKEGLDGEMVEEIRALKEKGNTSAHSIRVDIPDEELEDISSEATYYTEVLYEIWSNLEG